MGYEDRDYYRDETSGFGRGSFNTKSMVVTLIIINVVIFFVDVFTPEVDESHTQWLSYTLGMKTNQLWQFWTILTHGFAHASFGTKLGIFHLLGNMITLYFLGRSVEDHLGRIGFLWFYLCSIVVGGLTWLAYHLAIHPDQTTFIVGASGAVSAVTAYFIFKDPFAELFLFGVLKLPAWAVGVFFLISNITYALSPSSHVAWQAHMGGAAFGWAAWHFKWTFLSFQGISNWSGKVFKSGPKLRVHDPGAADDKLKLEADRILAKISAEGESSLTRKESRTLKRYSNQLRKNRSDS